MGCRLIPLATFQQLTTVEGLNSGRTEARQTEPAKPVPAACVEFVLPFARPQVAAMIQLQRLAGMRPGEVRIMRTIDLDTSGPVWFYRPGSDQGPHDTHKTAYHGKGRVVTPVP